MPVEHLADLRGSAQRAIVAVAHVAREKEMAGFLDARERPGFLRAQLHVAVPGLPVFRAGSQLLQNRVRPVEAGRLDVHDEPGA